MQNIIITGVKARQIYDSRGNPTVEVDVTTQEGRFRASVPSGASTGEYEALELRDGDKTMWLGKGVQKAIDNVNNIIGPAIIGQSPTNQAAIDRKMIEKLDGTRHPKGWYTKGKLGANAILGVSLAVARAGAAAKKICLWEHIAELAENKQYVMPVPCFNIINGGSHAGNGLAFQEFMIMPTGAGSFKEAMRIGAEVYQTLKGVIKEKYGRDAINVGDEGGFAPPVDDARQCLELIREAVEKSGHKDKIQYAMDVAASEFYNKDDGKYDLKFKLNADSSGPQDESGKISGAELLAKYKEFIRDHPIVSIEDGFDQDDWKSWSDMTEEVGEKVQIVGDDLLVTNSSRIKEAVEKKAANALLLKVNQIGTLTEAMEAVALAKKNGWGVMTSHRSGETEDPFIADLAVGLATGQIKTGAPCRSERLAKYNQLLRIEEQLIETNEKYSYAGSKFRMPSDIKK